MGKLNKLSKRKIQAIVISNDDDEKVWELRDILFEQENIELKAFLDTNSNQWGTYHYHGQNTNIEVVSVGKAITLYHNKTADIFLIYSCRNEYGESYFQNLRQMGINENKIWFLPYHYLCYETKSDKSVLGKLTPYLERSELETVELHVAEHCNLNCKFCSMFCGLVKNPVFLDYDETKRGLLELKKYIQHVKKFRLVGGEPLLNPKLEKFIDLVREIYPYTDIRLISNGILVKDMDETLIQSIVRNHVTFIVTGYQPLMEQHEEIHKFLKSKGIQHSIEPPVIEFQKIYDYRGLGNPEYNFQTCSWKRNCATLYGGKLAPCFPPFVIHYLVEEFSLDIPESGIMNLYESEMSAKKIHLFFDTCFDLCRYCSGQKIFTSWTRLRHGEKMSIEDWSI